MGFWGFCFNSFIFIFFISITNFLFGYHETYIRYPTIVYFKLKTTYLCTQKLCPFTSIHHGLCYWCYYLHLFTICIQGLERGWSQAMECFRVHSWDWGCWACYPRHRQVWLLPGLLVDHAGGRTQVRVVTICWSVARTAVHKPVIWVWASLKWCSSVLGSTTVSQLPICIPKLPQRHFCSWKTAKLLLEWRNMSRETSILPSYWCPSQAIFKKHV